MLPTPLGLSEKPGDQRASAILRFDVPRVGADVFSALQNSALLSATRRIATAEERPRLEAELRQRFQVTETAGDPGSPGTPDQINTVVFQEIRLDARALEDLQRLIDRFRRGGESGDSWLVRALGEDLRQFSTRLDDNRADDVLGEIIGRIEHSVIGRHGLEFTDLFRDPGLFLTISTGLDIFADETNRQAGQALRDVIFRIGGRRFGDDNPQNDSVRSIGAAIDRLGRALDDEPDAVAALDRFLDRLQERGAGAGGGHYAGRIAGILDAALDDVRSGSLDLQAVERLQAALQDIRNLQDLPGRWDNRWRARAIGGLEEILERHTTTTTRTETMVTPGRPPIPATQGERAVTILEETTLVPKAEAAQRIVTIYQSAQESLRPLQKLSEPPPPVPNLQVLVTRPDRDDEERHRFGIAADDEEPWTGSGPCPVLTKLVIVPCARV